MLTDVHIKKKRFSFSGQVRWRRAPLASPPGRPRAAPAPPRGALTARKATGRGSDGPRRGLLTVTTSRECLLRCTCTTIACTPLTAQDQKATRERCVPDGAHDSVRTRYAQRVAPCERTAYITNPQRTTTDNQIRLHPPLHPSPHLSLQVSPRVCERYQENTVQLLNRNNKQTVKAANKH